ncbi:MAG: gamma-glutamyl-gamma-aminobutyrate hydrolase family protein [Pseudomonadota bacterium]
MQQRLLCVRHGAGPTDDRVTSWCTLRGVTADIRRPFQGDQCGDLTEDLAGVVVFGGMFDADSEGTNTFLREEYRIIDAALKADVPLLGICQGAQMLARALGAWAGGRDEVHEFGYYEVSPTEAGQAFLPQPMHFTQAHWHTFDIPQGAVHLASSDLYPNQAFRHGKALGVQFHPECTIEGFRRWQDGNPAYEKPGCQDRDTQERLMGQHDRAQAVWFYTLMDEMFGGAG